MRLVGVNIPDQKRVDIALTYIYGIGRSLSVAILKDAGVDAKVRTKDLTPDDLNKIKGVIEQRFIIEGELRQKIRQNVERMRSLGAYRGVRHAKNLPVRGQSTKRNSRTVRGNVRKTATSGKRKVALK